MKPNRVKVVDLMSTALVTVAEGDLVTEARERMEVAGIRHLLVVDARGHLVGVLSDRDLLRAAAAARALRVGDVMSRDPVTIRSDAPAHVAATMMIEHQIGSVAVVDDGDALVGLVTQTDFLDVARRALLGQGLER